jgi:hypothetical protein
LTELIADLVFKKIDFSRKNGFFKHQPADQHRNQAGSENYYKQ